MDWNTTWTYFGRVDNALGVATVGLAGYSAYRLFRENKRRQEFARQSLPIERFEQLVEAHQGIRSLKPVALAVCLIPTNDSIRGDVTTFLRANEWEMPIEELNMDGLNSPEDRERFVNLLREVRRDFEAKGYTEIHLFIAGPVQAGTIIGGLYRNWMPIKLYHKPNPAPPQVYAYWMPLI